VVSLGVSDKAMAVKVKGGSTYNKIPHITLAVSPTGKPKDSNDIQTWKAVPNNKNIKLKGIVKEYPKDEAEPLSYVLELDCGSDGLSLNAKFTSTKFSQFFKNVRFGKETSSELSHRGQEVSLLLEVFEELDMKDAKPLLPDFPHILCNSNMPFSGFFYVSDSHQLTEKEVAAYGAFISRLKSILGKEFNYQMHMIRSQQIDKTIFLSVPQSIYEEILNKLLKVSLPEEVKLKLHAKPAKPTKKKSK